MIIVKTEGRFGNVSAAVITASPRMSDIADALVD